MNSPVRRCFNCGTFYMSSNYAEKCPRCGKTNTIISLGFNPEKDEIFVPPEKLDCPKCKIPMAPGYTTQQMSIFQNCKVVSGLLWSPVFIGEEQDGVPVIAYACPKCGYIEHKLADLVEVQALIEQATKVSLKQK